VGFADLVRNGKVYIRHDGLVADGTSMEESEALR
jgi:hypothetical protein